MLTESTCSIDGCAKPIKVKSKALCQMHYFRIRQGTPMHQAPLLRYGHGPCAVEGCEKPRKGRYCTMHYMRIQRHGDPSVALPPRPHSGPSNGNWKGEDVRYQTAHQRRRTKAMRCVQCGALGRNYQWALNWYGQPYARCDVKGERSPFSTRPEDYVELCVPCHKRMDLFVIASGYDLHALASRAAQLVML